MKSSKDGGGGGDGWSHKTCKAPVKLSPPTNTFQLYVCQKVFKTGQNISPSQRRQQNGLFFGPQCIAIFAKLFSSFVRNNSRRNVRFNRGSMSSHMHTHTVEWHHISTATQSRRLSMLPNYSSMYNISTIRWPLQIGGQLRTAIAGLKGM